jgi:polar amino acid transport system permease protein
MDYTPSFDFIFRYWDLIVAGTWLTIQICVVSTILGLSIGTTLAGLQTTKLPIFTLPIRAYVEAIRNTPFLVQLFIFYFGLSSIGLKIGATTAGIIALSINTGAYATEIIRAGIESIPRGQIDAGNALGLSKFQIFKDIIISQAYRAVYPSITNQFILFMLGSSVLSAIAVHELTFTGNYIASRTFRSFEVFLFILVVYFGLSYLFRGLFYAFEFLAFAKIPQR